MADVTYYFINYISAVWSLPDFMIDGDILTYGYTASTGATQVLTGNTCPATDLGTILKVEIRAYGYGDADDLLQLIPVFAAGNGDTYGAAPGVNPVWSSYYDITASTNAPSPWTWAAVQALDVQVIFTKTGKANTMRCAKVEIRVTYWAPPVSDIDVGSIPIDRDGSATYEVTWIDKANPANASGTLQNIKVYAATNITGFRVGTFYVVSGNTLKCRDSAVIGNVTAGSEQTFTELAITVEAGDYIGCYFSSGALERGSTGGIGLWSVIGEYIDPNDQATYSLAAGYAISLYGYGSFAVVETTVANEFPMGYYQTPGVKELRSKVSGATISEVAKNFPHLLQKSGKAKELISKWS